MHGMECGTLERCLPVFCTLRDIFIQFFAVTFCHVLHLDVIRSQTELKLKVKTPYVWL